MTRVATTTVACRLELDAVVEQGDALIAHLGSLGIKVDGSSWIATARTETRAAAEELRQGIAITPLAVAHAASLAQLAGIVLNARATHFERTALSHYRSLARGVPAQLTEGPQSEHRDRAFELLCARACSLFSDDTPAFVEPDVVCHVDGHSWGIACKVAYSKGPAAARAIWKGAKQIHHAQVEAGVVAVQLVNIFPHFGINLTANGEWTDALTRDEVVRRLYSLLEITSVPIWERMKRTHEAQKKWPHRKAKSMLFVVQTIAVMEGASYVVGTCHHVTFGPAERHAATDAFAQKFQRALERLSGQSGPTATLGS